MPILQPPTLLFSIVICRPLALLLFLYSPHSPPLISLFFYSPNSRLSIDKYLTLSSLPQLSLMPSPIIYGIDSHLETRICDLHGMCHPNPNLNWSNYKFSQDTIKHSSQLITTL